jgi:hypothetical protein
LAVCSVGGHLSSLAFEEATLRLGPVRSGVESGGAGRDWARLGPTVLTRVNHEPVTATVGMLRRNHTE